jgi:hypothetical protein
MSFSEKVYRFLLREYPHHYRSRYAQAMDQLFRDRLREVHTFAGLAALWVRTLADWAAFVPMRYWEGATPRTLAVGILRETDTLAARLLRQHIPPQSDGPGGVGRS